MLKKSLIVATALLAFIPVAASAGEVQNRIDTQHARINQGVRNGSLTYGQDMRLNRSLDRVQAQRNYDLRHDDGHLTGRQYTRLNHQENDLSTRIYWDKHT